VVRQNLTLSNNADWRQTVSVTDAAGAVVDLTAAAIQLELRARGVTALSLSLGNGLTITDAAAGEFRIDVDEAEMAALGGLYEYDALVEIGGVRERVLYGSVHVRDGVTQWS